MKYPYVAAPEREMQIQGGYTRLRIGMSVREVEQIMGLPDGVHDLYEPKITHPRKIGYTLWYFIEVQSRNGSSDEKGDNVVRVSFNLQDQVIAVDHWGL